MDCTNIEEFHYYYFKHTKFENLSRANILVVCTDEKFNLTNDHKAKKLLKIRSTLLKTYRVNILQVKL